MDCVKIADFGISRHIDTYSLTADKGTLPYMAPEVIWISGGTRYSYKADIWFVFFYRKIIILEFSNY